MSFANSAQVLAFSVTAWRHLNAWDGFSTKNFSLKNILYFLRSPQSYRILLLKKKNPTEADGYLEIEDLSIYSGKNTREQ